MLRREGMPWRELMDGAGVDVPGTIVTEDERVLAGCRLLVGREPW